jgi:hypothetical protein
MLAFTFSFTYQLFCKRYFAVLRKYRQLAGRWAWRETAGKGSDHETVAAEVFEGQYSNPVRIIGFNISEGLVRDGLGSRRPRAAPTLRRF